MFVGVKGAVALAGRVSTVGGGLGEAFGGAGGAAPGERLLFAGGGEEQRHVDAFAFFAFATVRSAGSREQAHERGGVAVAGDGARRGGEFGAQDRVEVAREQDVEQLVGGDVDRDGRGRGR